MTLATHSWTKLLCATTIACTLAATTGCHVDTHKKNGDDNVNIATPFGGMSVKTNEGVVQGGVGMSVYPGSILIRKDKGDGKGKDDGAADVNLSFGNFHLGVKALSYQTSDSPDKVLAFYRKDMAHFGTVILCHGKHVVGTPVRTQEGLACDTDRGTVQVDDEEASNDELKAGSRLHQHIVSMEPKNGGTKIGLVALDLPGNMGGDDDSKQ